MVLCPVRAHKAVAQQASLPPGREAAEEDRAANKRNRAIQAISSPALQPPERVWKKGEPVLQVIRRQAKDPKHPDKKEAFRGIDGGG
jgi:hypothetical protein